MPFTRNFLQVPFSSKGLRRFPKGERKALWSPPQRRNPAKQRKARKPPSLPSTRNQLTYAPPFASKGVPRRFPKGERKALWSPPQRRNPAKQRKARKPPSLPSTRNQLTYAPPFASKGVPRRFPKGERKALWSPPQRRNPAKQRKARKPPPLPSTRNPFLVRGFVRLRADEVLSPRGKVPKGRRGRPRGACGVAAPGPPVAKQQCTASLAGARPAGLTAYLGGPLSPSAQSIPPPVRWRRLILGVMARGRCHRGTLQRYLAAVWGPCRLRVR